MREVEALGALGGVAGILMVFLDKGHQLSVNFSHWFSSLSGLMARQSTNSREVTDTVLLLSLGIVLAIASALCAWGVWICGTLLGLSCLGAAAFYICAIWDIAANGEIVLYMSAVIFGGAFCIFVGWMLVQEEARAAARRAEGEGGDYGYGYGSGR